MSRRREVDRHRRSLGEIRGIMNSMKTLAFLETHKLDRFMSAQEAVVGNVERAAADFLAFHPQTLPDAGATTPVYLVIGSERGFCGDFNRALWQQLDSATQSPGAVRPLLLPVGRKLHALLAQDPRVHAFVVGASVVEEVADTLLRVVHELTALQREHGPLSLYALCHGAGGEVHMRVLLPPLQHLLHRGSRRMQPPDLNLPPRQFLLELADHYLFAVLHEILYASLLAENQLRVAHLDAAVRHLDQEAAELARRSNVLRQEEIIEEIEVILLSAAGLHESGRGRAE